MADNDYTSGLNDILGNLSKPTPIPQSPEQDIKNLYEGEMQSTPSGLGGLIENSIQSNTINDIAFDQYAQGVAAGQMGDAMYAGLDAERYGPAPQQQITDPNAMIGSTGQRVARGLKAGWGDLVSGTGDTIDWISAAIKPGEGDLTTSVGSYLKKVGTEYQNENALILAEDLQEIEWHDMFDGEFWSSKMSRLVPYALSFILPSGVGAVGATRMLGRFGPTMLKSMKESGKFGRMSRGGGKGIGGVDISKAGRAGFKGQAGSGVLGQIGIDLGKQGYKPTKLLRNTTAFIGAGTAGNLAEGAYLSGEAYQEMINEVDENGQPMFTPQEAAHHAAGVMVDNAAWIGVDAMQYALLFGGLGRGVMGRLLKSTVTKKPFGENMKALTGMLARRAADTPVAATYLSAEALTEGFQEVFQEWAKYAEIQEAKGEDWDSWTTWMKEAPLGENAMLRDVFWSSFGLGAVMGGARGYYDAYAERKKKLDDKIDGWNNIIELAKEGERNPRIYQKKYGEAIDNSLADTVWDYYGDGSVAMAMIDNYVKDKLMTEELAEERKSLIENMEKMYEKHTINSGLTEAGAKQAFRVEVVLSDLNRQESALKERYQGWIKQQKEIFKNDKDKLNKILEQGEIEFKGEYRAPVEDEVSLETIRFQKDQFNQRLEDIYARRLDQAPVAKSTGKRDARFKKEGLDQEKYEKWTQEGEKQKQEREKAEAEAKAKEKTGIFETVKDLGGKAVEGVKSLFGKAKESQAWKDVAEATKGIATKSWAAMGEALKKGAEKRTESMARRMVIEEGKKRVNRTNYSKAIEEIKNGKINSAKQILKQGVIVDKNDIENIKDLYNVDDAGANAIINKILDNDIKNIEAKLKENPNLTGEELKELIIKEMTSEKGKEAISSILNKVKERFKKKDTKKTEEETIDVEYEDVTEKTLTEKEYLEKLKKDRKKDGSIVTILDENSFKTEIFKKGKLIKKENIDDIKVGDAIMNKQGTSFVVIEIKEDPTVMGGKIFKSRQALMTQELKMKQGIYLAERVSEKITSKKSQADVKKKDQPRVVPKTEQYQKTEASLEKGARQIKKADIQKGTGPNYFIKTPEGETIQYRDFDNISDKYVLDEGANVELRLRKPIKGQEGVVEVDGKLYFQFDNLLYETEIEVVINGEVVGKVAQRDYKAKEPTKKAKKKDTRKIDQLIGAVKESKEKIKKYFTRAQKDIPDYNPESLTIDPLYRHGTGIEARTIVEDIVQKRFPGSKGFVAYTALTDDFGQEASSLAIGSTIFINENSVKQSDIIHEAGHIYYNLMGDTPLMKKIKKLLPKSELYQKTKKDYPELTLMKFKDLNMTLGLIYREIFKNTNKEYDSFPDLVDIANNIAAAEKAGDSARVNDLFVSLRTQLKINGGKDVRVDRQKHLLEETFTRTLESFSYGTVDAVVKGSAAQKQLEKDLIQFYKETKKLATEEEARKLLDLSVDNIASLDLEAAMKHILLDFNSADRTVPYIMNSAYGPINKANKKILRNTASYSAVSFYISENIQLEDNEQIVKNVMQLIADDSALTLDNKDVKDLEQYIHSIIIQLKDNKNLKEADRILDERLSGIGLGGKHKEGENVKEASEETDRDKEKLRVLPTTTTNFIKKIVEYYNRDKDEKSMISSKKILSAIMSLAKETKNNPYSFIIEMRKSLNPNIQNMVMTMDQIYSQVEGLTNPKRYTNAKLVELKGPIEGINIEVLAHNVLSIGDNGQRAWYRNLSTNMTIEKKVLDSILKGLEDNTQKEKDIAEVYNNLFDDTNYLQSIKDKKKVYRRNDIIARNNSAEKILNILFDLENGEFINKDVLLNNQIMFNGKKQFIHNILFDHTIQKQFTTDKGKTIKLKKPNIILKNKDIFTVFDTRNDQKKFTHKGVNDYQAKGVFRDKQIEIRNIVTQGLVMSRAENYITMIDNVEQDGVSVLNKDNGFWSRTKNVFEVANSGVKFGEKDLINPEHNIFVAMAQLQGKEEGKNYLNPFNITVHSGMMRYFEKDTHGLKNKEGLARKANDVNPNELTVGDFFMFLSRYNEGKRNNEKTIYYDQPIAVFADKSRRYYIQSIIAHDAKSKKALLSRIAKNPAYKNKDKNKYKLGDEVFPYKIKNNRLVGEDMNTLIKNWRDYMQKNRELFLNNKDLKKVLDSKRQPTNEVLEAFLTSYIANKFMAQQLFVHDHRQSDNEIDYIKRAAGAIAGHTNFDRNTSVEFFVTNDYYVAKDDKTIFTEEGAKVEFGENWKKEVAVENDAMGYVLPKQAELIRAKYGDSQKVGSVFKFVYHYTELDGPLKDRTTYMKFAVHTLTKEMEDSSPYLKNLGEALRERTKNVRKASKENGKGVGNLIIGASKSAAKLYAGEQRFIHDITSIDNMEEMFDKQDEIYKDAEGYRGLSGEGFGIQLELDKQTDERFFPSQLFYNLLNNITEENRESVARMLQLREKVMKANNEKRNSSIIEVGENKNIFKERDSFKSSVTADIYDILVESSYDNLHPMYPYLNAPHNAVATGRITHKGTKMYTKGSIGYQSSSIGMGLRSYQKGLYKGQANEYIKNEDIVVSEAIVPGYLKDDGVKVGDLFIGTRVPAHGKVSSSVFIVKGFHKQVEGSPNSNVTIPAWVSKFWGADLDGDSIHMNFRWTNEEVAKREWKKDSNEFFDRYVALVSQKEKEKEIKADIDFVGPAKNAIELRDKIYGVPKTSKESQLTPEGDGKMFEDNVPAKHLVGRIAALMRTFNVFSNSQDRLPVKISIKNKEGVVEHDKFFDNPSLENNIGNWYGVAQLLNIALDNAKYQYASQLGMNQESIFSYVLLRRLGYSLNDLTLMFNAPFVKKYLEYKRAKSKNYISKDSDIMEMFADKNSEFKKNDFADFMEENQMIPDIKSIIKNERVDIDINNITNKDQQQKIIELIYILDNYDSVLVSPFSKAFTVHQTIEKNPLELNKIHSAIETIINNTINGQRNTILGWGGEYLNYELENNTINNPIVTHGVGLFKTMLDRAEQTDIRYSPYIRRILEGKSKEVLNNLGESKSEVINQVIANNIRKQSGLINRVVKKPMLIKEFKELKENTRENYFLDSIIQISEDEKNIVINRQTITDFTSYKTIQQAKDAFADLSETSQDLIFEIEYLFNLFGYKGGAGQASSFVPFFDDKYVERINDGMNKVIEHNKTAFAELNNEGVSQELLDAIEDVQKRKAGLDSLSAKKERDIASKDNNNIYPNPIKKPKKVITADTSYNNDHLGGGVEFMSFPKWAADKGIDISKIEEDSNTFRILTQNYSKYKDHLRLVREFEATLEKKPLSKYTMEGLYDEARKFRKMDNSATKGIAYTIEKEIGQRAFQEQAKYLRDVGASKGYEYNIPGVDGVAQDDLTNFQAWLGSNNMTSKRPEIQYLINEAQKEYRKYMRSFKEHKNLIEEKNNALKRSKLKGLSILERVRKGFDSNARYQYIYGNIATVENGNVRLFTPEEIVENGVELTRQEEEYYATYKAVAEILLGSEGGETIVPGMQMGTSESMARSGLFGLYSSSIDSYDYNRVKVYGIDANGDRALKTFYEWKYDVYKGRTGKLKLKSGREIFELDKLRRKAKELKAKGKHEDNSRIILSDVEYDALVNNGAMLKRMIGYDKVSDIDAELIQEYERRKGVRAQNISYDINTTLLEFTRSHIFQHGEGLYKLEDGRPVEREDRFTGMGKVAILTDSIIGFNKNLDNKNAVRYLTGWWKEGFLEKKQQVGIFGKTGDKVIDTFVRLTSLRLLGFNMSIGIGNTLAGKYQELRKRGGKQFIKGEARYWKNLFSSRDILKKYRIIEYSFDEFMHLSERKGTWGKIERWSYMFMDGTESYIQGAAFLGELTDEEFRTGEISEERVMHINHKISTLHGEGYTALDASLLSMYSYGRALLQFKKWFITLIGDRFKAEDIDRFGDVNIGSYRASSEFITDLFRKYFAGGITKKEIIDIYNNSSEKRKREMRNHVAGIGIGVTLLSLIAIMEDDDEPDTKTLRTLKKLSHDVFITTDLRRFVNYTAVPSSFSTFKNANKMIYEAVRDDKVKRTGPYGKAGSSQAIKTMRYEVSPFAEARKDLANLLYEGPSEKKETSSLIR